ncbi:hypothetical protein, partial [Escherichia coli]|uniref:hypothetical protein n=1 Tax=Escherichia coli TaxID=562 RepID=UPI001BDD5BE1
PSPIQRHANLSITSFGDGIFWVSGLEPQRREYSGLRSTQRHRQNYQSAELQRLLRQKNHPDEVSQHSGEVCFFVVRVCVYGV